MPSYSLGNELNITGGFDKILLFNSQNVNAFAGSIFFFFTLALAMAGYFSEKRSSGRANFFMWSTISLMVSTLASFVLFMSTSAIISIEIPIILLVLFIVSSILFFLQRDEG